jgi:hypothetical protein
MRIPVRIVHSGLNGVLRVQVVRTDVPAGEPHALMSEQHLRPGEGGLFNVYARGALIITEERHAQPPRLEDEQPTLLADGKRIIEEATS